MFKSFAVPQEFGGNVDVKTKIVHFYVQRNTTFTAKKVITFEFDRLNEGGAMNVTTGIFTAPHSKFFGYYKALR